MCSEVKFCIQVHENYFLQETCITEKERETLLQRKGKAMFTGSTINPKWLHKLSCFLGN